MADMLIVDAYRNILEASASIAKSFHVSDSHAHKVFDLYIKLGRLSLTDAISIDKVHPYIDSNCRYEAPSLIHLLCLKGLGIIAPYFYP